MQGMALKQCGTCFLKRGSPRLISSHSIIYACIDKLLHNFSTNLLFHIVKYLDAKFSEVCRTSPGPSCP